MLYGRLQSNACDNEQVNPHVEQRVGLWTSMSGLPGLKGNMDRCAV